MEYQMRNWYYFNWICGDHILEQHIHNIDVANWFIGSHPVSAQGMGGRQVRTGKEYGQIFDHHFVEFVYPEGQVIASQCRHQRGCMNRVDERFQGTKGSLLLDSNNVGRITGRNGSTIYDYQSNDDVNPYQQEHNELFASIKAGNYDHDDTPHGIDATMTAILGRMATYTGKVITWDDALATDMNLVPEVHSFEDLAPVQPDENGFYPVPMPGQTKLM
jgi:predicted dehydrogenase